MKRDHTDKSDYDESADVFPKHYPGYVSYHCSTCDPEANQRLHELSEKMRLIKQHFYLYADDGARLQQIQDDKYITIFDSDFGKHIQTLNNTYETPEYNAYYVYEHLLQEGYTTQEIYDILRNGEQGVFCDVLKEIGVEINQTDEEFIREIIEIANYANMESERASRWSRSQRQAEEVIEGNNISMELDAITKNSCELTAKQQAAIDDRRQEGRTVSLGR